MPTMERERERKRRFIAQSTEKREKESIDEQFLGDLKVQLRGKQRNMGLQQNTAAFADSDKTNQAIDFLMVGKNQSVTLV